MKLIFLAKCIETNTGRVKEEKLHYHVYIIHDSYIYINLVNISKGRNLKCLVK